MTVNYIDDSETGSVFDSPSTDETDGISEPDEGADREEPGEPEPPEEKPEGDVIDFSTPEDPGGVVQETGEDEESDENMVKVALDWVELEAALENNSPELHSFLNTVTGDVIRVFEGTENAAARLKQAEASPDFVYIEPISSRDQYHWMEEFIEIVEEPTLKDKLNIAIDGKGAFRRFKDVLVGYPVERERWFSKRSTKLREHMRSWLKSKLVMATNNPPWEGGEAERPVRSDASQPGRLEGTGDLRVRAHEILDIVPTRELPIALAFLEFLRNRRDPRRGRYP